MNARDTMKFANNMKNTGDSWTSLRNPLYKISKIPRGLLCPSLVNTSVQIIRIILTDNDILF